jgi:DNA-binding transcriptional ArsR family regulator
MESIAAIENLAVLAQESRLAIFRMLGKRGRKGHTPTRLSEKLNVSSPTLSFHLLIGFLTQNCCVLGGQRADLQCAPAAAEISLTKRRRA